MDKENEASPYEDIIDMPHHVSTRHRPMPIGKRAAQFAPFAALSGHDEAIDRAAEEDIDNPTTPDET